MPVYEYECCRCHSRCEQRRGFEDDDATFCSECGGTMRRLFTPVPIIFKGSGFYCTDHRTSSGGGGDGNKTESTKEQSGKKEETKTSESKDTAVNKSD
ncbi:MAG: FmdB family zinc ribbon protein [Chloroflexota bacterium]|nr:FmdB family zinc ribbon protein [Chloroflexota bacterium]